MQATGNRYTLDLLSIEHTTGDEMSMLQFGEEDPRAAINGNNAATNNRLDEHDSGMDK